MSKKDYSKYSDFDPTPSPKLFGEKTGTKERTNTPPPPQKQRTFRPKQKDKSRGSFSR
ncbi:hypothetical protein L5F24_05725 [Aliarcobacter butzleri]|uniref:hypothetical protein n=1 Tax=Aliarcobacter butzleri TaxID=28197 RepID=UPI001EDB13FE|nr:hypothetical protein [Aliarcobacter butzleri]MCG3667496.1 hypothetical protein [Aliarcobacter butzleri]